MTVRRQFKASRAGGVTKYADVRDRVLAAMRAWPAGSAFPVWAAARAAFGPSDVGYNAGLLSAASQMLALMAAEGVVAWAKVEHRHRRRGGPVYGWVLVDQPKIEIAQQKARSHTGGIDSLGEPCE